MNGGIVSKELKKSYPKEGFDKLQGIFENERAA
jgi:hypothetical protein